MRPDPVRIFSDGCFFETSSWPLRADIERRGPSHFPQFDGIFIGSTRTADMMWTMIVAMGGFALALHWLADTNRGLWIAFLLFFALRGLGLALRYPALVHATTDP